MGAEDALRNWGRDTDDRCPVCYVPPGAWHLPGECIHSGPWKGPKNRKKLPDATAPNEVPSDGNLPAADHDVSGGAG